MSDETSPRPVFMRRARILIALLIREMCARFGRSIGGYIWAIAEPAGGILLLAIAFSFVSHKPPIGTSFMLFYATGIVPFMMYNTIANSTMLSIRANRGLLAYPVVTALDTILARCLLDTLTYCVIAAILFPAIILLENAPANIDLATIALAAAMASALGLGVGTLNCVLIGFFPTWQNVWSMINRPLFVVSGVLFSFDSLPTELRNILWFNPVAHVIGTMREGIYGVGGEGFVSLTYLTGMAMTVFVVGAFLLRRNEGYLVQA